MIVPNKVVTLEESALGPVAAILDHGPTSIDLMRLYESVSDEFESIDQFMLTIDLLYVLGRIDIDFKTRTLSYVD